VTDLPDRRPIEVVLTVGEQGSDLAGFGEMLSQMTFLALQHQAPFVDGVRLLIGTWFEPAGMTGDPKGCRAHGTGRRRLATDYLTPQTRAQLGLPEQPQ
jgi:hypothetical protein